MIRGITYSNEEMTISAGKCLLSMSKNGVNHYSSENLSAEFYEFNKEILDQKRGAGYWLWKPYIIYKAMIEMADNDLLIYSDAGVEFMQPVKYIIDRMEEDIFFFTNGFPQVEWCKGDVLNNILGWGFKKTETDCGQHISIDLSINEYKEQKQVQASVIFFRVNQKTKDFVKEWLLYCQMPGFIDDSPSKFPNYPTFAEHRHDQAILTCLQIKHGYKLHWWPTQYSEHIRIPGDNYPAMFNHHRKRNSEW